MRLLLLNKRGATSFEDLRTVNDRLHNTFFDAANALGLIDNNDMWISALEEGACINMPTQFRELFAYACVFGTNLNIIELFEQYKYELMEDFTYRHQCRLIECTSCLNELYLDLRSNFMEHDKTNTDYGLPELCNIQYDN